MSPTSLYLSWQNHGFFQHLQWRNSPAAYAAQERHVLYRFCTELRSRQILWFPRCFLVVIIHQHVSVFKFLVGSAMCQTQGNFKFSGQVCTGNPPTMVLSRSFIVCFLSCCGWGARKSPEALFRYFMIKAFPCTVSGCGKSRMKASLRVHENDSIFSSRCLDLWLNNGFLRKTMAWMEAFDHSDGFGERSVPGKSTRIYPLLIRGGKSATDL